MTKLCGVVVLGVAGLVVGCGNRCEPGETVNDGEGACVAVAQATVDITCGAGTRLDGRRCVPTGPVVACGAGTAVMGNTCVPAVSCGENTSESNDACVPAGTVCAPGTIFAIDRGTCVNNSANGCGAETSEDPESNICELDNATLCGPGTTVGLDGRCIVPASVQLIHDISGVAEVDLYIVSSGTALTDGATPFAKLAFREATAFAELPSNESFDVVIAADGESDPRTNALLVATITLGARSVTRLIATDQPDAEPALLLIGGVAQASTPDVVAVQVLHGASGVGAIDAFVATLSTGISGEFALDSHERLADDLLFAERVEAQELNPVDSVLTLALDADGDDSTLESELIEVSALLEDSRGSGVLLLVSGRLEDATLHVVAVNPDGTTAVLPRAAQLQVIHNAADPAASLVDLVVSGELLEDVAFRTATQTYVVPTELDIEVRAPDSDVDLTAGAFDDLNLVAGARSVAVVSGVLNPLGFAANPEGADTALGLFPLTVPAAARSAANVDLVVFHGSTDTNAIDIDLMPGATTVVSALAYGSAADAVAVAPPNQADLDFD
ncbi:MAG: DUF4397 domain-containing protein, partial [Myxococcota bacterium]